MINLNDFIFLFIINYKFIGDYSSSYFRISKFIKFFFGKIYIYIYISNNQLEP